MKIKIIYNSYTYNWKRFEEKTYIEEKGGEKHELQKRGEKICKKKMMIKEVYIKHIKEN